MYTRTKKAAQRGQYAPALNPAVPAVYPTPYQNAPPYEQNTEYHSQMGAPAELPGQYLPPYQAGEAGDYYQQQPTKPANIV